MKIKHAQHIFLYLIAFLLFSACEKGKNWTSKAYIEEINSTSAEIKLDFDLGSNKKSQFVGYRYSKAPDPEDNSNSTIYYFDEFQINSSEARKVLIENLEPNTEYNLQAFIYITQANVYSEEINFTTLPPESAPCATTPGKVEVYGSEFSTTALDARTGDKFTLANTFSGGDFEFNFLTRPTKSGIYYAVPILSFEDDRSVVAFTDLHVDEFWPCSFYAAKDEPIYVTVHNAGNISITLCETVFTSYGSCEDINITGDLRE